MRWEEAATDRALWKERTHSSWIEPHPAYEGTRRITHHEESIACSSKVNEPVPRREQHREALLGMQQLGLVGNHGLHVRHDVCQCARL